MPAREKEYILFADESVRHGKYFSHFYGGLIIGASCFDAVSLRLDNLKDHLGFHGEVKWSKVTDQYLDKYSAFIHGLFDEMEAGHLKIRIMFSSNADIPPQHVLEEGEGYFKLYYQFIKHAFGLKYISPHPAGTKLRIFFDEFPSTGEQTAQFKGFIHALGQSLEFRRACLRLALEDITEVRSHDHVLLQGLDVILGAMAFRLNDMHKQLLPDSHRRGKRTRAKERLYQIIVSRVKKIRPRFNFGVSTGKDGDWRSLWTHPYRHWRFKPYDSTYDRTMTKNRK